ncbi:hypothetical protein RI367_004991 [Sorochytrium milnesiophthora]
MAQLHLQHHHAGHSTSLPAKLLCGSIAGIIGTLCVYPLDIVKTRLQNQSSAASATRYRGVIHCFRSIVAAEGLRGLYRGLVPNLVGITPEKAIKLAVNDYTREFLALRLGLASPDALPIAYGMLAGATAGTCQVIATCPMEITKIQMQLASINLPAGAPRPTLTQIVRQLGLRGMYKGTAATLARDVPFSILFFPSHAYFKSLCANPDGGVDFQYVFGSGILAGWLAAAAVTPMDVIKTRLQAAPKPGQPVYSGILQCGRDIAHREGVRALFKGTLPRCMIVSPLFGITLFIYELQQRYFA